MAAESDLAMLIHDMRPRLLFGTLCFCHWTQQDLPAVAFVAAFREDEGWTIILEESIAIEHGLHVHFRARCITLEVHSDLHAVGFLAEVSKALANAGIPCNVISAIHHDHLFVPIERGESAIAVLERLAQSYPEV